MRWKSHVRFGGQAGKTHRSRDRRALRSDPYTYVPTWTGFGYLATVLDVFNRRIVGSSYATHMRLLVVSDSPNTTPTPGNPAIIGHCRHSDH